MKLYDEVKDKPAFDLRQKTAIDPTRTDLQIFMGLSNDDVWTDAELPSVFLYLYENEKLCIPNEWQWAMLQMKLEMQKYVTWLQLECRNELYALVFIVASSPTRQVLIVLLRF
jgi:hypothetical protein